MDTRAFKSKDSNTVDTKTVKVLFDRSLEIARYLGKAEYHERVDRDVPSLLLDGSEQRMNVDSYKYVYEAGSLRILFDGINITTEIKRRNQSGIHPDEHGTVIIKHRNKTVFEASTFGRSDPELKKYDSKNQEWQVLIGDIYERLRKSPFVKAPQE